MFYAEFPPGAALARAVRCIWIFESAGEAGAPQRIVPDGHPELVVHWGDPFREAGGGVQPRVLFAGQLSGPLVLHPGVRAGVVGVRFLPAAARVWLGVPMRELKDQRLDLGLLWGPHAHHLAEAVAAQPDAPRKAECVRRFLVGRLAGPAARADELVERCVAALQSADATRVATLVAGSGVSARQLERRFQQEVGLPPRLLASILRFRRVFDVLEQGPAPRWVHAAVDAGYFDQAHMIRDFRRFAGCTPRQHLAASAGLATALTAPR